MLLAACFPLWVRADSRFSVRGCNCRPLQRRRGRPADNGGTALGRVRLWDSNGGARSQYKDADKVLEEKTGPKDGANQSKDEGKPYQGSSFVSPVKVAGPSSRRSPALAMHAAMSIFAVLLSSVFRLMASRILSVDNLFRPFRLLYALLYALLASVR